MLSFFYKIQKLIFEGKYGHELLGTILICNFILINFILLLHREETNCDISLEVYLV